MRVKVCIAPSMPMPKADETLIQIKINEPYINFGIPKLIDKPPGEDFEANPRVHQSTEIRIGFRKK